VLTEERGRRRPSALSKEKRRHTILRTFSRGKINFEFFGAIFCLLLFGSFLGNIEEKKKKKRREEGGQNPGDDRYALQPKRRLR